MTDGFVKVGAVSPRLRVADPAYNAERIIELIGKAEGEGIKVLVFPELSITGYTAGDLFFQKRLRESADAALDKVIAAALQTVKDEFDQ